jgi:hypothetical protein
VGGSAQAVAGNLDGTTLKLLPNPIWLLILITITSHFAARDAELDQLKMLVE